MEINLKLFLMPYRIVLSTGFSSLFGFILDYCCKSSCMSSILVKLTSFSLTHDPIPFLWKVKILVLSTFLR